MTRHRRPDRGGAIAFVMVALVVFLATLFIYSVDQALQDADRRLPVPSTSTHREGTR